MPSYKVKSKGFFGGVLYDPQGKRPILNTDLPFSEVDGEEQVPGWLEAIPCETPAQARARKGAETKARNAAKKKAEADKKEIEGASFLGGEASSTVETL